MARVIRSGRAATHADLRRWPPSKLRSAAVSELNNIWLIMRMSKGQGDNSPVDPGAPETSLGEWRIVGDVTWCFMRRWESATSG